ncbi:hypothetical protein PoHVEF18_003414 [Penicillium ochrochloron]
MTIEMPELEQLTIDESAGEFNKQPPAGHDGDTSRVSRWTAGARAHYDPATTRR